MYLFFLFLSWCFLGEQEKNAVCPRSDRDVFPIREKNTFILPLEYNCIPVNTEVTKLLGAFLQPHGL